MEILPLRVGVGKFFFTEGCIAFLPEEIHRLGPKALMIGGPNSMPALIEHLPDGWDSGLEIIREVYAGACSVNQAYACLLYTSEIELILKTYFLRYSADLHIS